MSQASTNFSSVQELNLSVAENDDEGALRAIATYSCAFRHPARLAHIQGMAAAAEKAGFSASFQAFRQAVQMLPNAPEPEVRCAFVSQLVPLGAWPPSGCIAVCKRAVEQVNPPYGGHHTCHTDGVFLDCSGCLEKGWRRREPCPSCKAAVHGSGHFGGRH